MSNNESNAVSSLPGSEKKEAENRLEAKQNKSSLFVKKAKEYIRGKKASSMYQIFDKTNKINIKINQNINIKIKNKESGIKTENIKKKSSKLQTFIYKNNNVIISPINLSKKRSHELDSSYKMENFLDKNLKLDSFYEKQDEQYLEFFINNNIKNKEFKLHDNTITTNKYSLITFIPKGLLIQFFRLSNIYFLFTAIIQSIPLISPLTSVTSIVPLIFVLGVSLIREGIEDLSRHNYDNLNNEEEVIVLRDNKFVKTKSKTLRNGEIILVYENKSIPTDMILIDSGFSEGICYVETSSLDGEKTLKLKVSNKYTKGFISNDIKVNKGVEKVVCDEKYLFNGFIRINWPNADLNYVNGIVHTVFEKEGEFIDQEINISINDFLLKGSILKNTNWIIGIVAYTGMNNKIILNSKKPRLKISKVEKNLNYFLLFVFVFLIILCIACSIIHSFNYKTNKKYYDNFIIPKDSPNFESFICFFTYFLLLNTLIPISLIVSTEIIKIIQGIFIRWDILLYSKVRHCFCGVKSISIIEELGNINFIFSDKTGTLTKNQLEFKYCIIGNKVYEYSKSYGVGYKSDILSSKIKESNNSFSNLLENNNKNDIMDKLNIYDINEENLEPIEDIENDIYIDKTEDLKESNMSNKNQIEEEVPDIYKQKSRSSNRLKNYNFITKYNNVDKLNDSNNTIGSHNSHKESNKSPNFSNFHNQINNYKQKKNELNRNSTILEIKNEDYLNSFSNSTKNDIITFGEGYFMNYNYNEYLKNIDNNEEQSLNYIHEFWKALAITNECMVKEEKGEIRYMGTSPDDLELVKAAMKQGYKLINTCINSKTVRIAGKDYIFEILKVLGFSSERKRMSIIIKDKFGIKLYSKGADSEISKRLSQNSLESENYKVISNGLSEYSKQGLRTLMVAYRKIREQDYISWVNRLTEDELNLQNKQKVIEKLYDIIETNLTLIGGTVVEDKLQDKVPETIKELRAAGIKLWVLTGDKLDTAENIGYSCNLLSKEQKLFSLKVIPGDDDEKVKENPYMEMSQFFSDFQNFIENLVKKYNLDSKYALNKKYLDENCEHNLNRYSNYEIDSPEVGEYSPKKQPSSNRSILIDFDSFKYLRDKKLLEPFSIIIEAPILAGLFKDPEWTDNFLNVAYHSNTVICCRVSPSQKSQVIQKMKEFDSNAITLAIGDGGNDVSMIMEANIGIGIYGEEGMSAAQASDFSIGEFHILKRLLFIHGRVNLIRISKMILYFFFKNFAFTMIQFYYAFYCLGSGQTFVDDWYITCYNLVFTAFPLCVAALTDSDINLNGGKITKKNLALLYMENRDKYKIFSFKNFSVTCFKGILIAFIILKLCLLRQILSKSGYFGNIWCLSLKCYISVLAIVSSKLIIDSNFIAVYLPLSIFITTFLLFGIFLILNHYGILFEFNSKASIFPSLSSPMFLLTILLISCFGFILDYTLRLFTIFISNSISSRLFLEKSIRKSRKFSILMKNRNASNKSYYHFNKNSYSYSYNHKIINKLSNINNVSKYNYTKTKNKKKIRSSLPNHEISTNYLIKSPKYILTAINNNSYQENNSNKMEKNNNKGFTLQFRNKNQIYNYNYNENRNSGK